MRNHFKDVHIPTLSQSVEMSRLYGTLKTIMPPQIIEDEIVDIKI